MAIYFTLLLMGRGQAHSLLGKEVFPFYCVFRHQFSSSIALLHASQPKLATGSLASKKDDA